MTLAETLYWASVRLENEEEIPFEEADEDVRAYFEELARVAAAHDLKYRRCTPGEALDALIARQPVKCDGEVLEEFDFSEYEVTITFCPGEVWEIPIK